MSGQLMVKRVVFVECGCGWAQVYGMKKPIDGDVEQFVQLLHERADNHLRNVERRRANHPRQLRWHDEHGAPSLVVQRAARIVCKVCATGSSSGPYRAGPFLTADAVNEAITAHVVSERHREAISAGYLARSVQRSLR